MLLKRLPSRERENGHVVGNRRESPTCESPFVPRSPAPGRDVRVDDGAWSARVHPEGCYAVQR